MSRTEWLTAILLAFAVVVITSAPYLVAWSKQSDDWRFSGFLFGVEDGNSYLGKMRLGARGVWDFYLFYTPEAHDGEPLVFLPYIIPGQIVGQTITDNDEALTPALIEAYHIMGALFDALLVIAIYRFAAAFLDRPRDRLIATVLAALGGGLGWLLALTGQSPQSLPDLFIPEGFSFLILFGLPHLALARAALLGGLLAVIQTIDGSGIRARRAALLAQERIRLSPRELIWLMMAGVCWLIVGLSVPFYLVIIYCILGAWGLASWVKRRSFPVALFLRCVIAAGITLPLFLFYAVAFSANPAFAAWSAQNNLISPSPVQYILAYLPLGLMAAFGFRRMWSQPGMRNALLIGWVLIVPILVYLPINVQRRMSEAVIVPLAILAAAGLRTLAEGRVTVIIRGALIVVSLLTSLLLLLGGFLAASHPARPLFRPAAELNALNWLNLHSQPDAIALGAVETGNVIPAWTHLRTYMGHGPETIQWPEKTERLTAFYSDSMSADERADFIKNPCAPTFECAGAIHYFLDGPIEQQMTRNNPPQWAKGLRLVYNLFGYRIYSKP